MKKLISVMLALMMTAVFFSGCESQGNSDAAPQAGNEALQGTSSNNAEATSSGRKVKLLRIGGTFANDTFSARSQAGAYGQANYYSFSQLNLWRTDEKGELTGDGCFFDSWDISDDNLTITLHFSPLGRLMWHDGTPVTTDDVVFTFNHYKDHSGASFQKITNIELISDTSLRLTFSEPVAFGFMHMTTLATYLLPKHVWEHVETPRTYREPNAAIGAGPFRLVSVDKTAQISYYEAVEDYPIGDITIDRVELKSYDNQTSIILAMLNDQVDVMYTYSSPLDHTLMSLIAGNNDIDPGGSIDPATYQMIFGFDRYPTNDINFRKGVAYALDYELIAKMISGEYSEVASTNAVSSAQLGYVSGYPRNRQDVELAKQFLDTGGFIDIDNDGFRELPDGGKMDIGILIYYYPPDLVPKYRRISEIMKVNLAEAGIRIYVDEQSLAGNRDYILDVIRNNKYELWLGSTTMSTATWGGIANYVADTETSGRFFGTLRDPEYLEAYTRMLVSTNYEDYKRAYADIQRMNAELTTAIVWDITHAFYPFRSDKFTGWVNYPGMGVINGETWYKTRMK